jgi:hypothetical protein
MYTIAVSEVVTISDTKKWRLEMEMGLEMVACNLHEITNNLQKYFEIICIKNTPS